MLYNEMNELLTSKKFNNSILKNQLDQVISFCQGTQKIAFRDFWPTYVGKMLNFVDLFNAENL